MTTPERFCGLALVCAAALLSACAAPAPVRTPVQSLPSQLPQPALVIGTFSYHYAGVPAGQLWRVHLERLDSRAARQEYALAANLDAKRQRGVFSGMLPPGVYAFRDAGNSLRRYAANGMPMPFVVEAGEVRDLGHYALDPLTPR
jgi:hypothetical protein